MIRSVLASKKNIIVISAVVITLALMIGSYYTKKSRIQKQAELGGISEIVSDNVPLPPPEYDFARTRVMRFSHVADIKTTLTLPSGDFESNVRVVDAQYPLVGYPNLDRSKFNPIFSFMPQKKIFGVAVNKAFLEKTRMEIGQSFKMNDITYQLRGTINTLPDISGQKLMQEGPLLMLRHPAVAGSGMFKAATVKTFRYRLMHPRVATKLWEKSYRERFPKSTVVINKWDA